MLISKEAIFLNETLLLKKKCFHFIAQKRQHQAFQQTKMPCTTDLQIVNNKGTTGMMDGFAIPHAKSVLTRLQNRDCTT